ncbi:MAG: PEP-CTERM sorting domain-containing protein [Verrucomicrobiaceae bacterium]
MTYTPKPRHLACLTALSIASIPQAQAAFHLYDIQEVYSNSDGTVQFIELFTASNSQQFLNGHELWVRNSAAAVVGEYVFPSNGPSPTANTVLLLGTSNLTALYGVTPDFVIPANFLNSAAGNYLDFDGQDLVNIDSLPLDGTQSLDGLVGNNARTSFAINANATPTNYAGQTATVPEPSTGLVTLLGLTVLGARRKR